MVHTIREMGMAKLIWCCGCYGLRSVGVAFIISTLIVTLPDHGAQAARLEARKVNPLSSCGLKCFRWQKCMGQVSGLDARPKELGNTGIIILNKCVEGKCDCQKVLQDAKKKKKQSREDKSTTTQSSRTKPRTSNNGSSSSSRFSPVRKFRNPLRERLSGRKTSTTTTTTTRRPLLRGKLGSRFNRPKLVSDLRAALKPAQADTSSRAKNKVSPKRIVFPSRKPSIATKRVTPKRKPNIVFGFSDDKPIQVELDSPKKESPVDVPLDTGASNETPFIVMATSVSSSFSSSVGRSSRRSDVRNRMARKGKLNRSRGDRINVFKRFFPRPHFLHKF